MQTTFRNKKSFVAFAIAAAIVLALGVRAEISKADISNPHPVPPTASVTGTIIANFTITDANMATGAAVNLSKISQTGDATFIPYGSGSGLATTSKLTFNPAINTFSSIGSTTLGATTTINGVQYVWPSTQGSVSSALVNNGSGVVSWAAAAPPRFATAQEPLINGSIANATDTAYITVPANTMTASSTIEFVGDVTCETLSTFGCYFGIGDAISGKAIAYIFVPQTVQSAYRGPLHFIIQNNGKAVQNTYGDIMQVVTGGAPVVVSTVQNFSLNTASAFQPVLTYGENDSTSGLVKIFDYSIVVNP